MKLTAEQADLLRDVAWDTDIEYRDDYSGRGMYEKTCVGVVGTPGDFAQFMVTLTERDSVLAHKLSEFVSSDSMGRSTIYYFPGVQA